MSFFTAPLLRWLAIGVCFLAVTAGVFYAVNRYNAKHYAQGYTAGKAAVQLLWDADVKAYDQALLQAAVDAAAALSAQTQKTKEAQLNYEQLKQTNARSAADASHQLDSLRTTLSQISAAASAPQAPPAQCRADVARISEQLAICATHLTDHGRELDRLAAKITGLQDYIAAACHPL